MPKRSDPTPLALLFLFTGAIASGSSQVAYAQTNSGSVPVTGSSTPSDVAVGTTSGGSDDASSSASSLDDTVVTVAVPSVAPAQIGAANAQRLPVFEVSSTSGDTADSVLRPIASLPRPSGTLPPSGSNGKGSGIGEPIQVGPVRIGLGFSLSPPATLHAAGRIIDETTFGATAPLLLHVEQEGVPAFVDEQLSQTPYQMPYLTTTDYSPNECAGWMCNAEGRWWRNVLWGSDQLNQRVALVLSQIYNISFSDVDGRYAPQYLNILSRDALGNWFTLMQDVTLSPAMGTWLNMANSGAAPAGGHANENFARENMQLFSLGVNQLNIDGSTATDANGKPIPNYTPDQVQAFARVFTGYTFANNDCSVPNSVNVYWWGQPPGVSCSMTPVVGQHDTGSKTLLNGTVLPAGQSPSDDVNQALQNIFLDSSLPPFVSRRLIQGLVTSNPSPGYVARIAQVFVNDGTGVRGNLKAVVRAILLDPEARAGDVDGYGSSTTARVREPILELSAIIRPIGNEIPGGTDLTVYDTSIGYFIMSDLEELPHAPPSVFGAFQSDYTVSVNGSTVYAPEAQLDNVLTYSELTLHATDVLAGNWDGYTPYSILQINTGVNSPLGVIAQQDGPTSLVALLNGAFMHGDMPSQMQSIIENAVTGLDPASMVQNAIHMLVTSPQFRVIL